jgi:hypothetical protein
MTTMCDEIQIEITLFVSVCATAHKVAKALMVLQKSFGNVH